MAQAAPSEDFKYAKFLSLLNPTNSVRKVGIALFGLGRAGTIHLQNLLDNSRVELKYVVEERESRRNEVQSSLGLTNTQFVGCEDIESVLSDSGVKAVVVATPTTSHQNLVIDALNNGKGVFCEKPIAKDIKDIQLCYKKAKELGLPLFCAFNRRFDPSFLNVKEKVQRGYLGPVHVIKTCSRDSPLPSIEYLKISNGIFHDCAVHDIDLICWVLKEFPVKVFAAATAHREEIANIKDHDTVCIHLTFPSGAMAIIDLSRFSIYGYDQRLEVFGPKGMLSCGNQQTLGVEQHTEVGKQEPPIFYSFASRYEEAYKRELNHFLNVVEGIEEIEVRHDETIAVCRIALACENSVKSGIPVTVEYND